MCIPGLDPLTLLGLIGGIGSAAAGLMANPATPPEAQLPAVPAPILDNTGADVRINMDDTDQRGSSSQFIPTELKRSSGKSLGGLGRSGLAL